jgi:uncharacterized membrane protein
MRNKKTDKTVMSGLFAALTAVATLIMIPVPSMTNGYVNAGDALVILSAFLLGPGWGALAAALGSALTDLIYGYYIYIPATFIIKGLMALAAGTVLHNLGKKHLLLSAILASIVAELIMLAGYFGYETVLYSFAGALGSLFGNAVQAVFGAVVGTALYLALIRIPYIRDNFQSHNRS